MKILVAKSHAAPPDVVRSVTAALGALNAEVHTVDLGRIGATDSRLGRVVKALVGEAEASRLVRELSACRPDVAVAFDAGAAAALVVARDRRVSETPVVAVVPQLQPDKAWAVAADRFAVVDDEAAVALGDLGIDGVRVLTVGPVVPQALHEAAALSRAEVRREYNMPDLPVVLVDSRDLPDDMLQQATLQLSLLGKPVYVLFDAAASPGAAGWLRRNVPTLGLKGKLFGDTPNAPRLWRAADVVVARPTSRALLAARALGCAFIGLEPRDREEAEMQALVDRGQGAGAKPLLLAAALAPYLKRRGDERGPDGATGVAELVLAVAAHKGAVLAETVEVVGSAAAQADEPSAGEPEDIESFGDEQGPWDAAADRRRADLDAAEARAKLELDNSRRDAEKWDERRATAETRGDARLAADAAREADRKRARMHQALETLARLARERASLRAEAVRPSEDDVLAAFKDKVRGKGAEAPTVDDELAALKRRMQHEKKP